MPGHENWSIVSFPDHYYHLLLPKTVTDVDSTYYKGKHGAEITGLTSMRSVWNYPIRPAVAPRWDAFKWRSNLTAPSRDLFFNIVDPTDGSTHRVRRRYRYYVKTWSAIHWSSHWAFHPLSAQQNTELLLDSINNMTRYCKILQDCHFVSSMRLFAVLYL